MSQTEFHKGKLIPLNIAGDTLEEKAENACGQSGIELPDYYNGGYLQYIIDECYETIYILDGKFYKVKDEEIDPDYDIYNAEKLEDGSISYEVKYYNGGCGFSEALDTAIKKLQQSMNKRQALIDYASSLTQLKDIGGGKQAGCCPIHEEKTASFHIYANGDQATCFGCGFQGDVFDLYIALNGGSFLDAKKALGFAIKYNKPVEQYLVFSESEKWNIYHKCEHSIINSLNIKIKIKGKTYSDYDYIYFCIRKLDTWEYFFRLILSEIKNSSSRYNFYCFINDKMGGNGKMKNIYYISIALEDERLHPEIIRQWGLQG